jgi:hypothetical protein
MFDIRGPSFWHAQDWPFKPFTKRLRLFTQRDRDVLQPQNQKLTLRQMVTFIWLIGQRS